MSLLFTIAHLVAWLLWLRGVALPEGASAALLDPTIPLPATFPMLIPQLHTPGGDDAAIVAQAAAVFPSPGTAGVFVLFGAALARRRRCRG